MLRLSKAWGKYYFSPCMNGKQTTALTKLIEALVRGDAIMLGVVCGKCSVNTCSYHHVYVINPSKDLRTTVWLGFGVTCIINLSVCSRQIWPISYHSNICSKVYPGQQQSDQSSTLVALSTIPGGFLEQRASAAESASKRWHHNDETYRRTVFILYSIKKNLYNMPCI